MQTQQRLFDYQRSVPVVQPELWEWLRQWLSNTGVRDATTAQDSQLPVFTIPEDNKAEIHYFGLLLLTISTFELGKKTGLGFYSTLPVGIEVFNQLRRDIERQWPPDQGFRPSAR